MNSAQRSSLHQVVRRVARNRVFASLAFRRQFLLRQLSVQCRELTGALDNPISTFRFASCSARCARLWA